MVNFSIYVFPECFNPLAVLSPLPSRRVLSNFIIVLLKLEPQNQYSRFSLPVLSQRQNANFSFVCSCFWLVIFLPNTAQSAICLICDEKDLLACLQLRIWVCCSPQVLLSRAATCPASCQPYLLVLTLFQLTHSSSIFI